MEDNEETATPENEERNESPENEEDEKSGSSRTGFIVFLILFLLVTGLLVYYQFYQGNGQWRFTLLHKANDTTFLMRLKNTRPDTARVKKDTINIAKADSIRKQDSMAKANKSPDSIKNSNSQPTNSPQITDDKPVPGTSFEVQIGTFENYTLKHYDAQFNNLHEEMDGNLTKLTLGRFNNFKEANTFRKDLIKLGLKNAWVVKKVDGKRM